jgi:hypothetical protein
MKKTRHWKLAHAQIGYMTPTVCVRWFRRCVSDDCAGDLLPRRKRRRRETWSFSIKHSMMTTLGDVGLQVWLGALLMGDFVLASSAEWRGAPVSVSALVCLRSCLATLFLSRVNPC